MNKVIYVTVGIMIAIFPAMASAEKLWGHDGWRALCVPPRGEPYLIVVADDGFGTMTATIPEKDRKIINLYPKLEKVEIFAGKSLEIEASNSTTRVYASFGPSIQGTEGRSAWSTSPINQHNAGVGFFPNNCGPAQPVDWK